MSPEEAALLAGIAAHPTDRLGYLVYADWLDERGDPRGEFLRLSAYLLESAARLAELRPTLPADWVAEVDLFRHAVESVWITHDSDYESEIWVAPSVGSRVTVGDAWLEVLTEGRIVSHHSPTDGIVAAVFVRAGDAVRNNTLVAVVLRL